jgi:hypothetical protein
MAGGISGDYGSGRYIPGYDQISPQQDPDERITRDEKQELINLWTKLTITHGLDLNVITKMANYIVQLEHVAHKQGMQLEAIITNLYSLASDNVEMVPYNDKIIANIGEQIQHLTTV